MSREKQVPEIRFKGFSGEWAENDLGDLIEVRSAARVHKEQWTKAGVPFFRTSDVVSIYKGQENTKAYIPQELYQELSNRIGKILKNDLLITGGGSIGIPYLVPNDDPLYFKDADLLWLRNNNKYNGYFLYTFFVRERFNKYIKSISHIGTIAHYTIEQAKTTPINTCSEEEQTAIGNYFQKLDVLINQHQQKHDQLCNLKKAMLEKMFPKPGKTTPEIRFKGFSGEWEEKELREICTYHTSSLKATDAQTNGLYPLFDAARQIGFTDSFSLSQNYITIIKDGSGVGRVRLLPKNTAFIGTMGAIQALNSNIYFLLCALVRIDLYQHITSATIPHVYFRDYGKENCFVPKLEEQTAIGNYFHKLDQLISQHQHQITKLNHIKQACLSKMFV